MEVFVVLKYAGNKKSSRSVIEGIYTTERRALDKLINSNHFMQVWNTNDNSGAKSEKTNNI